MSLRRQLSSEGIAHANADSPTHARHVRQRREQREVEWIPESVEQENSSEVFKLRSQGLDLNKGLYYVGSGTVERETEGKEFESHLSAINSERRWNYAEMKRGGKTSTVRRKRKYPAVGETVVNLSPWQMLMINSELERWEKAGVTPEQRKALLFAWIQPLRWEAIKQFEQSTGWDVLGSYWHLDSNKIHVGIIHSRVSIENKLVGEKYLRTVGPWSVAQSRIQKIGASDPADTRLKQNLERFNQRHGAKTVPLDIKLHTAIDAEFDALIATMGDDARKRFDIAKAQYREWKARSHRDVALRSPSSMRVSWAVLRMLTPLLPPQVQATIRLSRNAIQAFQVISNALTALSPEPQSQLYKAPELTRHL